MYHAGSRALQTEFDTARLAERIVEVVVREEFDENDAEFLGSLDMFFLATADPEGRPTCSYKGGEPGFLRVTGPKELLFPNYDGNGMYLSMGNILANPHVGLLFVDFENRTRMRVEGTAEIVREHPSLAEYPEAQFLVRVTPTKVFPNCPRYIHEMKLVERSKFVPKDGCVTPVPGWKRAGWARDALPAKDPARAGGREVL